MRCVERLQTRRQHHPFNSSFSDDSVYVLWTADAGLPPTAHRWSSSSPEMLAELVDGDDARVVELAGDLRLLEEAAEPLALDAALLLIARRGAVEQGLHREAAI